MRRFLLLVVFLISLAGCNSDTNLSADITINGEDVTYIGYTGGEAETNNPPAVYKEMELMVVKPNEKILIDYQDTPKTVNFTFWKDEQLQEKNVKLENNFELTVPESAGVYVYNIATRWNDTAAGNYVFVIDVKDEG